MKIRKTHFEKILYLWKSKVYIFLKKNHFFNYFFCLLKLVWMIFSVFSRFFLFKSSILGSPRIACPSTTNVVVLSIFPPVQFQTQEIYAYFLATKCGKALSSLQAVLMKFTVLVPTPNLFESSIYNENSCLR